MGVLLQPISSRPLPDNVMTTGVVALGELGVDQCAGLD